MMYNGMVALFRFLFLLIFRVELHGWDQIPVEEDSIVCSNHQSLWDPLLISAYFPKKVHWMAKKELFSKPIFKGVLQKLGAFPVDREGKDIGALRTSLRLLREKKTLGIFPEGTRIKSIEDSSPKAGVGLIAVKTKSVVVPIHIQSSFKLFSKTILTVKEPISFRNADKSLVNYEEISNQIMERIYE